MRSPVSPSSTGRRALFLILGVALALSGCTATIGRSAAAGTGSAPSPSASPTPVSLSVLPVDNATEVSPQTLVTVAATSGLLESVVVTSDDGSVVPGEVAGESWVASRYLRPDAAYTVTVTARGPGGDTTQTSSFRTLKPKITATYSVLYNGMTVGVGMPVSIQFDSAVATKAERAEVEKLVTVTTQPAQEGSWGWLDSRQLMWRPKTYWKAGTTVSVDAPIAGVQTGDGKFVGKDAKGGFTVGSSMISTVDIRTHMLTVRRNGVVLRTIPVSTGRPGPETETRSGIKVIIDKNPHITMDSATIGIPKGSPGYYLIDTQWDLRVTWTGEFLHSAPWSVGAQGNTNVSHGCTNLSPSNALWMYNQSKVGDVVTFVGSSRVFQPTEGIGVWQFTWANWQAQSALA